MNTNATEPRHSLQPSTWASGLVHAGHYRRRRRREFLDFINELISKYPDKELHVVLDNLNTNKPKEDRWLKSPSHCASSLHPHPTAPGSIKSNAG
jgi:hypothetical protein